MFEARASRVYHVGVNYDRPLRKIYDLLTQKRRPALFNTLHIAVTQGCKSLTGKFLSLKNPL